MLNILYFTPFFDPTMESQDPKYALKEFKVVSMKDLIWANYLFFALCEYFYILLCPWLVIMQVSSEPYLL